MSDDTQIRISLDNAEARKKLDRFRDDIKSAAKEAKEADARPIGGDLSPLPSRAQLRAGVTSGVSSALSTPGAGGADALINSLDQLSRIMQIEGAARVSAGDYSAIPQAAAGAAIQRGLGPGVRARAQAIEQVTQLTSPFAAGGLQLSQDQLAQLVQQATTVAQRQEANRAAVQAAAGGLPGILRVLGAQ